MPASIATAQESVPAGEASSGFANAADLLAMVEQIQADCLVQLLAEVGHLASSIE